MACEYCKNGVPIWADEGYGEDPSVYIENGSLVLEHQQVLDYMPIDFCPMCGEKLGGDE